MKTILYIALFMLSLNATAQIEKFEWVTDYKSAINASKESNKQILVYAIDGTTSTEVKILESELFSSDILLALRNKLIFLKLNTAEDMYAKRMAIHFTNSKQTPGVALVDTNQKTVGKPLNQITSSNVKDFITFLESISF